MERNAVIEREITFFILDNTFAIYGAYTTEIFYLAITQPSDIAFQLFITICANVTTIMYLK